MKASPLNKETNKFFPCAGIPGAMEHTELRIIFFVKTEELWCEKLKKAKELYYMRYTFSSIYKKINMYR